MRVTTTDFCRVKKSGKLTFHYNCRSYNKISESIKAKDTKLGM